MKNEWKKGQITIIRWCSHHKHETRGFVEGWYLPVFAVNAVQNKDANPDWFSITHKPTGFCFLYYPTLDNAKRVAEFLEENYVDSFALLMRKYKRNGEPYYDTNDLQKTVLADETFMQLLIDNAVSFDELVKRGIAKDKSKFKW